MRTARGGTRWGFPSAFVTEWRQQAVQSSSMNAAKEEVIRLLELLPEDASLEDIQHHIYVRQKIDHGLEDAEAGRTLSEEELDQRMAKWLEGQPPAEVQV